MTARFYLLSLNRTERGPERGALVHLEPKTLPEIARLLAWMDAGGFDPDNFTICTACPDLPGVMQRRVDGKPRPVLLMQGALTPRAFREFHLQTWGNTE